MMETEQNTDVVIVGAGIAGLYTAYLLINEGFNVKILEAAPTYGGRIKSLTGFAQSPVELGAEFIHGKHSVLYELADYFEEEIIPIKGKSYVWWNNQLLSEKKASKHPVIAQALEFMENAWRYKDEEISVQDYLKRKTWFDETSNILDVFGMEYGTSNEKLGLKSLAASDAKWTSGKKHYKLKTPLLNILREFIDCAGENIMYNQAVVNIDYTDKNTITIKTAKDLVLKAKKVVCTVPLTMLKKESIKFTPELPLNKKAAIEALGMDTGIKVFLKFKQRFWKKKMWELYGTTFCPLYYQLYPDNESEAPVLVAYLMGKFSETFRKKGNLAVEELVLELDLVFGENTASKNFENSFVMDCGKEKYIEGTYSYDAPKSEGKRAELAASIHNSVFFAGEATNYTGHAATLHGAMETAERCYNDISNSLKPSI
jgi:monoamine oxidase